MCDKYTCRRLCHSTGCPSTGRSISRIRHLNALMNGYNQVHEDQTLTITNSLKWNEPINFSLQSILGSD